MRFRIKKSIIDEQHVKYKPEYDDVKRIADEEGISFGKVYNIIMEHFKKDD
ncbi:DUF111 family protein [bacterium]|nr:DUF111 family protein [bacterium]